MVLTPILESFTGSQVDLSSLDGLRGNFLNYFIFILFMWIVAAFGEEVVYRGMMVERLAGLLGSSDAVKWFAVFISSLLFGLAHQYQGISGIITTGIVGFILGVLFIRNKQRLWLTILTHGIYDMIGITLIYLDLERQVIELISLP
jgi:membrane protease YdiL (CAAX protease family)